MKQHITKNQWDELSDEERTKWVDFDFKFDFKGGVYGLIMRDGKDSVVVPTIGRMIEFLGDDYHKALLVSYYIANDEYVPTNEICDTLWEAVKYKLRNI